MGYNVMGYSFVGVESFLTVPGLRLWLDSRRMRTIDDNGNVLRWSSLYDNKLFTAIETQRPGYTDPWIDFNDLSNVQGLQLRAQPSADFRFFHDGSPFGYFELMGLEQPGSGITTSRIFTTRQGMGAGATISIPGPNGLRVSYQLTDGTNIIGTAQSAINTISPETVTTFGITRNSLSGTNNFKIYTQNVLLSQPTISAAVDADGNSLSIGFINAKRYLVGIKLLYDWTGFSSGEVEVFSTQVRTLLEQEKPNFVYPS